VFFPSCVYFPCGVPEKTVTLNPNCLTHTLTGDALGAGVKAAGLDVTVQGASKPHTHTQTLTLSLSFSLAGDALSAGLQAAGLDMTVQGEIIEGHSMIAAPATLFDEEDEEAMIFSGGIMESSRTISSSLELGGVAVDLGSLTTSQQEMERKFSPFARS
jgi:riboflavin synthase alpha subunit